MAAKATRAVLVLSLVTGPAPGEIDSRAAEIEAARKKKAGELEPDDPSRFEQVLVEIKDQKLLERFTAGIAGVRLKLGGLITGSGFAVGPEYLRRDFADGGVILRGSARASLKKYQLFDLQLTLPKLAGHKAWVDLLAVHRNYPSIDYFGPGPDSLRTGRSKFRLEDTAYQATAGIRPLRHLSLGVTGGYLEVNVGPGGDDRFISTDRLFSPALTPGINRQSDFLRAGGFVQYDYRDHPLGPRSGGTYFAQFSYFSDRKLDLHTFRRLDLEAQQYVPFFNSRRVIALRGKSVLTYANPGQRVPFYLQPTLGGSDDLRGFRSFRFFDDNMIVLNAEYRWESFSGLDMALFADAGKVFERRARWNFKDLEAAYGFGTRFNVRNNVFLRVDVGFSHEGYRAWLKFGNVF